MTSTVTATRKLFSRVALHEYDGKKLSSIVKCYNPSGRNSKERYAWIKKYLAAAVEEAIGIRTNN